MGLYDDVAALKAVPWARGPGVDWDGLRYEPPKDEPHGYAAAVMQAHTRKAQVLAKKASEAQLVQMRRMAP